jgi:hypothetical protein
MKALILLLLLICVGCQDKFVVKDNTELYAKAGIFNNKQLVLKDIPLPKDCHMAKNSISHGTEYYRYGEFNFSGSIGVEDIYVYYKEQMPTFFWKELSADIFETSASLKYQNENELVTILCRELDQGSEIKIIVEQKKG